MALLLFSNPAFVLILLIATSIYGRRFGYRDSRTRLCAVTLICLVVTFALSFGLCCYHPYYIDNGSEEFMDWRDRWVWAMWVASLWQFAIVPLGVIIYTFWSYPKSPKHAVA